VEDVVTQDEAGCVVTDKFAADDESLGQTVRRGLFSIGEVYAESLPSPSRCLNEGRSWGVDMMRISLIPASIRTEMG